MTAAFIEGRRFFLGLSFREEIVKLLIHVLESRDQIVEGGIKGGLVQTFTIRF